MVLTVESCPAISSSMAFAAATSGDTGPSGPSSCSTADSSPGPAFCTAALPSGVARSGPTSAPCMKSITQPWNFGSSAIGAPITRKITDTGIG